jgi:hypothetical protein
MGPQAAVVAAVGAAFAIVATKAIQAAAQVQSWKASLQTVTGSAKAADSAYRGLVEFAAKTPFTLDQSVEGFVKLRALGLSTSEAIMTSYGNTSAAMGKSMTQMIEAVADATTGEFERLKEFGIKASSEGDKVSFTFQGVTKTVGKNAKEIEKYLIDIGNTKFAAAMALQMQTLNGAFSNLEDNIFQMFARIGEGELGGLVKDIVQTISSGVATITPLVGGIGDLFGGILRAVWEVGKGIAQFFTVQFGGAERAGEMVKQLGAAFAVVGELATIAGKVVGAALGFIANIAGTVVGLIGQAFGKLFGWMVPSFDFAGQSAGEALMGILRAGQFIANALPDFFATALGEIKAMFISAGKALAASLTGDFSLWSGVDLSFSKTTKAAAGIWQEAGAIFSDREANRQKPDDLRGDFGSGNIDFAAQGGSPKAAGDKSAADKAAEAAAEKLKLENEFWETLKNQAATAALLPIEAENLQKQLELQKILGRELLTDEKERVNAALQLTRTNEFLKDARKTSIDANRRAGIEEELTQKRIGGMREDQLQVERKVLEFRADALAQGVDLQSEGYKKAEDQLRIDEQRLVTNERINEQLDRAVGLADKYSQTYRTAQETAGFEDDRAAARRALDEGKISEEVYKEILDGIDGAAREGGLRMKEEFAYRIDELGQLIGGKWGQAISGLGRMISGLVEAASGRSFAGLGPLGGLMDLFGRKLDGSLNSLGQSFQKGVTGSLEKLFQGDTWSKPLQSMSDGFKSFKSSFGKLFGKGGKFTEGLGEVLGTLGAGAQMGSMVAGLGKAIWGKFSNTGAQLGGAAGMAIGGPLGSLIGSTLGGIVGGLFKKTKRGFATISNTGITSGGNSQSRIDAAIQSGNSVKDTLARIADSFGGSVGNFGNITIGVRDRNWRVNGSGTSLKTKRGAKDFGRDGEEEAIRYALSLAIERGAITGIRASTNVLLKAGDDIEAQMEKALRFEQVFKDLAALKDPVQAAVDGLNLEFKQLTDLFKEAGASAAEWADLEEYRSLRMQELMKQETATLRDILKELNGEAGGMSPLALLQRDMADFATFQAAIAGGQTVNQSEYSDLVSSILDNAAIYGTNSIEYQNIIDQLRGATEGAIGNIESRFETDPTTDAIVEGTNATLEAIGTTNDTLARIEEVLRTGSFMGYTFPVSVSAVNGRLNAY